MASTLCGGAILSAYVAIVLLQKPQREYEIDADLRNRHDVSWVPCDASRTEFSDSVARFYLSGGIGFSFVLPDGERITGDARHLSVQYTENELSFVALWLDEFYQEDDLEGLVDEVITKWGEDEAAPGHITNLRRWLVFHGVEGRKGITFFREGYRTSFSISGPGLRNTYSIYYKLDFET